MSKSFPEWWKHGQKVRTASDGILTLNISEDAEYWLTNDAGKEVSVFSADILGPASTPEACRMTTDITELVQSLKTAANTTADAIDRLKAFPGDELIDLSQHEGEQVDIDIATLNQWYELSSPANVLALVEALEKAQQYAKERDAENQELMLTVGRLRVERENLECSHNKLRESMAAIHNTVRLDGVNTRLSTILSASKHAYDESSTVSALESRTVTVKLPKLKMLEDYLAEVAVEERKAILPGVRMEFHRALNAAGIKWEVE